MKTLKKFAGIFALMMVMAATASAQLSVWAGGGTDVSTNLCYTVVSAASKNNGQPVVTYLNATSDKSASVVQFYDITNAPTSANYVNSTVTLPVTRTNGFASGDIIVIQHKSNDTYERRVLTASTGATNLVVTVAPTQAVAVGDQIYRCVAAGYIPCGNTTLSLTGEGIYSGRRSSPLLLEVDGTSACQINAAAAKFVP